MRAMKMMDLPELASVGSEEKCVCWLCPPLYSFFFADCNQIRRLKCTSFVCGFALGQAYYYYLLRRIPFPYHLGVIISFILSVLIGVCNAVSTQVRCISMLMLPMYCGTTGRGVLKVVVLTYVVAGPITNMGMNAREVVRVFSCAAQLARAAAAARRAALAAPLRSAALSLPRDLDHIKETLQSMSDIVAPIEHEVEDMEEIQMKKVENDYLDKLLCIECRSQHIENKFMSAHGEQRSGRHISDEKQFYQKLYQKKLEYRCENVLTNAVATCADTFASAHDSCLAALPHYAAWVLCWPLKLDHVCNIMPLIRHNHTTCDATNQMDPGFGEAYVALKAAQTELTNNMDNVTLQYKVTYEQDLHEMQDAKETGERVMHAFDEKTTMMGMVAVALNVYVALLFLRVVAAAAHYHDKYLTSIEFDNVYITRYFKLLDERRSRRGDMTLLPLKKMERSKYIDVHSISYKAAEHSRLLTQILKVMLEVVTATTFVMLDRLFYEALDVVRQHAQLDTVYHNSKDLNIEVEGTGMLATLLRKLLCGVSLRQAAHPAAMQWKQCVPHPRAMSSYYYFKIYGGYLWILLLLYVNPYTLRLRRLTCSYFYPRREKQRILHLYNDILKKRMKMPKTLRRKAVQAVRAHYLSGENLLSLRMKFPHALGWLRVLPAARMTCLICGETEPRIGPESWHSCCAPKCPFVFCGECWREAGARCLACDPSLAELSDVDSLSDDEHPKY